MTESEIKKELMKTYLSYESVQKVAHEEWIKDGKPDGEQICPKCRIKIKDKHWLIATMILETLMDFDATTIWAISTI